MDLHPSYPVDIIIVKVDQFNCATSDVLSYRLLARSRERVRCLPELSQTSGLAPET
jgi:hypothetical protein